MRLNQAFLHIAVCLCTLPAIVSAGAPVMVPWLELDQYCLLAIYETLGAYNFSDSSSPSPLPTTPSLPAIKRGSCEFTNEVISIYATAKAYCTPKQFAAAVPTWQGLCLKSELKLIDLASVAANVTDEYIAHLPFVDPIHNSTKSTGVITSPVLLSKSYYERAERSYVLLGTANAKDKRFAWGLMGYWLGIIFIGAIFRVISFVSNRRHSSESKVIEDDGTPTQKSAGRWAFKDRTGRFIRHYFMDPPGLHPILSNHHELFFGNTIPNRLDLLIITLFWCLCVIFCAVKYDTFRGNVLMPNLSQQNWQILAYRSGILAIGCMPFLYLFAGRNNICIWITGLSFRSFNIYHRHIARAATVLGIVHGISFTVLCSHYLHIYVQRVRLEYFYMGIMALVAMSVLLLQASSWLRRRWYDAFLIVHTALGILVIIALFSHIRPMSHSYDGYLFPMIAVWAFDRAARLIRLVYCNVNVKFGKGMLKTSAIVKYIEESDFIRIDIGCTMNIFRPRPGQHYFLYQPGALRGWESHPFTLAAYSHNSSDSAPSSTPTETEKELAVSPGTENQNTRLTFYIRPHDGWTRRLRDQCRKSPEPIRPVLLMDGPYGHTRNLDKFDHVLMVVGGTGITVVIPYIHEHIARSASQRTRHTKIHLVWAVRYEPIARRIIERELAPAFGHNDMTMSLFRTRQLTTPPATNATPTPRESGDSFSSDTTMPVSPEFPQKQGLHFESGRPNIPSFVNMAAAEAKASSTSLAIMNCGPPGMADECRGAVVKATREIYKDVEYLEEFFGW